MAATLAYERDRLDYLYRCAETHVLASMVNFYAHLTARPAVDLTAASPKQGQES